MLQAQSAALVEARNAANTFAAQFKEMCAVTTQLDVAHGRVDTLMEEMARTTEEQKRTKEEKEKTENELQLMKLEKVTLRQRLVVVFKKVEETMKHVAEKTETLEEEKKKAEEALQKMKLEKEQISREHATWIDLDRALREETKKCKEMQERILAFDREKNRASEALAKQANDMTLRQKWLEREKAKLEEKHRKAMDKLREQHAKEMNDARKRMEEFDWQKLLMEQPLPHYGNNQCTCNEQKRHLEKANERLQGALAAMNDTVTE